MFIYTREFIHVYLYTCIEKKSKHNRASKKNASQFFIDKLCLLLLKEYMISDNISQLCILRCSSGNE